jgi:hypothetical protein
MLLFCFCLQGFSDSLLAQVVYYKEPLPRYAFTVEPLYLFNGGLRINAEKQMTKKEWLEVNITPYYVQNDDNEYNIYNEWFFSTSNSDFDYFSKLQGIGVGGGYKYYLSSHFFVNPGISYTFYKVKYPSYSFHPYQEDGLTFYTYDYNQASQHFNKFTLSFCFGGRTSFDNLFFIEYYGGLGQAFSFFDSNKKPFDDTIFGFGHTGLYLTAGMKFGFNIP